MLLKKIFNLKNFSSAGKRTARFVLMSAYRKQRLSVFV